MSKTVILAGGSGFLGRSLARKLAALGYHTITLTRAPSQGAPAMRDVPWDGSTLGKWVDCLEDAVAVVNLTGKSVNCRYTERNRAEILNSRVDSVKVLGAALERCRRTPPVLVQASSLAIYGDRGVEWCDERSSHGTGFSVDVCEAWEAAVGECIPPSIRRVILRIGFVLGRDGGALGTLAALTRAGLGGRVGPGRQHISWLHQEDMNEMFARAIEVSTLAGVYNATGPEPVTNAEFPVRYDPVISRGRRCRAGRFTWERR